MICLDANVIFKLLHQEDDSHEAVALVGWILKHHMKIIAPAFLKLEIYSILRKYIVKKEIPEEHQEELLRTFENFPIRYTTETNDLLLSAYNYAQQLEQSVIYDCLYLAVAEKQKTLFISADNKFIKKAQTDYPDCFSLTDFVKYSLK